MLGYLSYLCGELLGLSGIVTLFCCAVAISHYALHNIRSTLSFLLLHRAVRLPVAPPCHRMKRGLSKASFLKLQKSSEGCGILLFCWGAPCKGLFDRNRGVSIGCLQRAGARDAGAQLPDAELRERGRHLHLRRHGHARPPQVEGARLHTAHTFTDVGRPHDTISPACRSGCSSSLLPLIASRQRHRRSPCGLSL